MRCDRVTARIRGPGFTLVELLVAISIIVVLIGIMIPTLGGARDRAKLISCASSQRQLLIGIAAHAGDHQFKLPHGPTTMSPFGVAWSEFPGGLLWTGAMSSELTGAGVLMDGYIDEPEHYFCAGEDDLNTEAQLANFGTAETAVGSYAYRSFSEMTGRFLGNLGENSAGIPATCLFFDAQLVGPRGAGLDHTTHGGRSLCLGYEDGHVNATDDLEGEMVFTVESEADLYSRIVSEPKALYVKADSWE